MLKKLGSFILTLSMCFTILVPAYAANDVVPISNDGDRIEKSAIDEIFSSKPIQPRSNVSAEEEHILFQEILDELQSLRRERQVLVGDGKDTSALDNQICDLENQIEEMSHVIHLSESQIQTLGLKPTTLPSSAYVDVYLVDASSRTINGTAYKAFHIYAVSTSWGGSGNSMAYDGTITLLRDGERSYDEFAKTLEVLFKFGLGLASNKFAVADFLLLSRYPSLFERGRTQELLVKYIAQQTCVFTYVTTENSDWYDHKLTSEKVGVSQTLIFTSTQNGTPKTISESDNYSISSAHFADARYAMTLYDSADVCEYCYVGWLYFYYDDVKKGTIYIESYPTMNSIPGLK